MSEDADQPDGGVRRGVAVIIVNYRTKELSAEAVRSVLGDPLVDEVVVVDNGSGDGSSGYLRSAFPGFDVQVVESLTNLGFGGGANLGVSATGAELVFFLNSDAVARPGACGRLSQALAEHPDVGVVAPAVYLADGRTLQPDVYGPLPAPRPLLRTVPARRQRSSEGREPPPGWVSGVAMMMRRSDFAALGGFDPDFVMYLEDVDLCRRLQGMGKRVVRETAASVVHLGGRSDASRASRTAQFHRSKAVYLRKAGASTLSRHSAAVLSVTRMSVERLRAGLARRRG